MKPKADQEVDCAPKYMLLLMRWGILLVSIVTQGQSSEYDQAASLIEGFKADFVLADKGYDANGLIELIRTELR